MQDKSGLLVQSAKIIFLSDNPLWTSILKNFNKKTKQERFLTLGNGSGGSQTQAQYKSLFCPTEIGKLTEIKALISFSSRGTAFICIWNKTVNSLTEAADFLAHLKMPDNG